MSSVTRAPISTPSVTAGDRGPQDRPLSESQAIAAASLVAGIVSCTVSQPFNVLKTRQQVARSPKIALPTPRDAVRGLPLNMASTVLKSMLSYTAQDAMARQLAERYPEAGRGSAAAFASGCGAGLLEALVTAPMRRLMLLQMVGEHSAHAGSAWGAARYVYAQDGMRGFFTATGVVAARNALAAGVFFGALHGLRRCETSLSDKRHWMLDLVSGSAANAAAVYVTNPLDVVKSRMQNEVGGAKPSFLQMAAAIYREGGVATFHRGVCANLARIVPSGAAAYATLRGTQRLLEPYTEKKTGVADQ